MLSIVNDFVAKDFPSSMLIFCLTLADFMSYSFCYSLCEFLHASATLCPKTLFLWSCAQCVVLTINPLTLHRLLNIEQKVVTKTFHLGMSMPKSLPLWRSISCEFHVAILKQRKNSEAKLLGNWLSSTATFRPFPVTEIWPHHKLAPSLFHK